MSTFTKHLVFAVWGALAALASTGCSSDPAPAADTGVAADGTDAGEAGSSTGFTFVPKDTGKETVAVALKLDSQDATGYQLKVVVRGVSTLQGVAFRLSFDPQHVQIVKSKESSAWAAASTSTIAKFATRTSEGELWGGVGFLGVVGMDATSETTVAYVRVAPSGASATSLSFRESHNVVLLTSGTSASPTWLGGTFEPKK
jgi:hypothetical protein